MRGTSLAVICVSSAILLWHIWSTPADSLINLFTTDDSFYYLTVALNIANGHGSTFDGINLTNGFHPLWMTALVPIQAWAGDDRLEALRIILSFQTLVCVLPGLIFAAWIAASLGGRATVALVTGLALLVLPQRQLNGMESGLVIALGLLLSVVAIRHDVLSPASPTRHRIAAGILLGLLFLARTDNVFLIASWFGVALVRWTWNARFERGKNPSLSGKNPGLKKYPDLKWMVPMLLPVVALCLPYLVWNVLVFRQLMPISGAVKTSLPQFTFSPQFFNTATLAFLVLAIAGGAAAVANRRFIGAWRNGRLASDENTGALGVRTRVLVVVLSFTALLHAGYTLFAMEWGVFSWHFALYVVPALVIVADWTARAESWLERAEAATISRRTCAFLCLTILAASPLAILDKLRHPETEDFTVVGYRAAQWVDAHLPADARIAMKDSGAFGYFSKRSVTNLDGVINNYEYQDYLKRSALEEYIRDQGIQYLAQHSMRNNLRAAESPGYTVIAFRLPGMPSGGTFRLREENEVYRDPWGRKPSTHFVIWGLDPAATVDASMDP